MNCLRETSELVTYTRTRCMDGIQNPWGLLPKSILDPTAKIGVFPSFLLTDLEFHWALSPAWASSSTICWRKRIASSWQLITICVSEFVRTSAWSPSKDHPESTVRLRHAGVITGNSDGHQAAGNQTGRSGRWNLRMELNTVNFRDDTTFEDCRLRYVK